MTAVVEAKKSKSRKALRVILGLILAALFSGGILALMLLLAGVFESKVKVDSTALEEKRAAVPANAVLGVVRLIQRPREESAVGTVGRCTRRKWPPRSWPGSRRCGSRRGKR